MIRRGSKTSKALHYEGRDISSQKTDRLTLLAQSSGNIIFATTTNKFIDFSPDTLTICPNRITISYGNLLGSSERPLPIENVIGARVNSGFLYATLIIETFGLEKPEPIRYLRKEDARMARRYILALIECSRNKVDLTGYNVRELRSYLEKIGTVRH